MFQNYTSSASSCQIHPRLSVTNGIHDYSSKRPSAQTDIDDHLNFSPARPTATVLVMAQSASSAPLASIQRLVWDARLPLEIRLAPAECRTFDQADPYMVSLCRPDGLCAHTDTPPKVAWPRTSYIPLLLSRLHAFFAPLLIADPASVTPESGYLTHDGVPLKWHLPLGLLYDLYVLSVHDSPRDRPPVSPVPFKLTLHFTPDADNASVNLITPDLVRMHDFFINAVKEADFLRSGTAKPIMSLSAADSKALWASTRDNDLAVFAKIHQSLLPSRGQLRNVPLRIYLPASPEGDESTAQIKVLQAQVAPTQPLQASGTAAQARATTAGQPQTLGTALYNLIPSLFPSRRIPILARPILHGASIPLNANLEELASWGCYADGWLHIVIAMNG